MRGFLIEHGQTPFDRKGKVHGHLDPALDAAGRKQSVKLAEKMLDHGTIPSEIISSPRRRALGTASILSDHLGVPMRVDHALAPLDVGDFSGQDEKEVADKLEPYFDNPDRQIPGGETVGAWKDRQHAFLDDLVGGAKPGYEPALVTHSNVIGSMEAHMRGTEDGRDAMANPPGNGSITPFRFGRRKSA